MAKVQTRYGRLQTEGWLTFDEEGWGVSGGMPDTPLTFPIDLLFLLASDRGDDVRRGLVDLVFHYYMPGLLSPPRKATDVAEHEARMHRSLRRRVNGWRRDGVLDLFLRAARRATEGRFTADLGDHLERVRFGGGDQRDEVPDFLTLAAWSIDQTLRAGKYRLRTCELCQVPFLTRGSPRYCQRLAPRAHPIVGPNCQDVGKVRDYRARKRKVSSRKETKR